ncbi:MAG: alpha/beta hydrolase [Cytophagaceae bacterium]|nr:alpha/beta hydrolase [Cytophagaceae bacterium]MDW8455244.1 alpha/beta hydrolase [Cytophagaceae bacterium]
MKRKPLLHIALLAATIFCLGSLLYMLLPVPNDITEDTNLPVLTDSLPLLEKQIMASERAEKNLKPDNEARIIWHDSTKKNKTPVSVVYLHGFSASQGEAHPVHIEFARRYGCNLYLSRLYGHGINSAEPLLNVTADSLIKSAKYAVAVGKKIGERVILMSTSTGSTLSMYIASAHPDIMALIMFSPNVDLFDPRSSILTMPGGLYIARFILGSKYYSFTGPAGFEKYWTAKYRAEAIVELKQLIKHTMHEQLFSKIRMPVFMAYYYKNETQQDNVVSVKKMLEMFQKLGTPKHKKRKVVLPEAGTHALASGLWSQDIHAALCETFHFAESILEMKPLK